VQIRPNDVVDGDREAIVALVDSLEGRLDAHPGLRGWYLYDEPILQGVAPALLEDAYRWIRTASSKPVMLAFGTRERNGLALRDYGAAMDLFGFHFYASNAGSLNGWTYGDTVRGLNWDAEILGGMPWWITVQAFGEQKNGDLSGYRLPTREVLDFFTWLPFTFGEHPSSGMLAWSYWRSTASARKQDGSHFFDEGDGGQWLAGVYAPLAQILETFASSAPVPLHSEAVALETAANMYATSSRVYWDAEADEYFLVAASYDV